MSGADTIIGSLVKSSHPLEYSVSKLGRTTARSAAVGYAGTFANVFIGPPKPLPGSIFVSCLRVTSMVTNG